MIDESGVVASKFRDVVKASIAGLTAVGSVWQIARSWKQGTDDWRQRESNVQMPEVLSEKSVASCTFEYIRSTKDTSDNGEWEVGHWTKLFWESITGRGCSRKHICVYAQHRYIWFKAPRYPWLAYPVEKSAAANLALRSWNNGCFVSDSSV